MAVKGYLVFVPFENVASMDYGSATRPDRAVVATTPGDLAGPFDVAAVVRGSVADAVKAAKIAAGLPVEEGTTRTHSPSGDFTETETRIIPAGVLQVTSRYQVIMADDAGLGVETIGWHCTLREARLNGVLVTDPQRAQALAGEAGIAAPEPVTWIRRLPGLHGSSLQVRPAAGRVSALTRAAAPTSPFPSGTPAARRCRPPAPRPPATGRLVSGSRVLPRCGAGRGPGRGPAPQLPHPWLHRVPQ